MLGGKRKSSPLRPVMPAVGHLGIEAKHGEVDATGHDRRGKRENQLPADGVSESNATTNVDWHEPNTYWKGRVRTLR